MLQSSCGHTPRNTCYIDYYFFAIVSSLVKKHKFNEIADGSMTITYGYQDIVKRLTNLQLLDKMMPRIDHNLHFTHHWSQLMMMVMGDHKVMTDQVQRWHGRPLKCMLAGHEKGFGLVHTYKNKNIPGLLHHNTTCHWFSLLPFVTYNIWVLKCVINNHWC